MTATLAEQHRIHDALPSGFHYADALQAEEYTATGSINGASKIVLVRPKPLYDIDGEQYNQYDTDVAVRLRPPRTFNDIISPLGREAAGVMMGGEQLEAAVEFYVAQYNLGWSAGGREYSPAWDSGLTNAAWDDGYLDRVAQRPKWHTTWCADHDTCGEG